MIWKTKITHMLGIKYPLVMGAFGGWGKSDFASAFSNAGGLGVIAALNFPEVNDFKDDIEKMRILTDKPFAINLSLPHHKFEETEEDEKTKKRYLKYVEMALNQNCKIFTTSGYKAEFIGRRVQESGAYWFHKCVLVRHALSAEKQGADAVTIVGLEGTGFKNPLSHSTLINITMAKRLLNIPLIAAGGIGDARGFLATLAMGADAVCLGTALMASEECPVPQNVKERWINLDIFDEDFYQKIYHYNLKNFMAPSTAIGHFREVVPINILIHRLMSTSESILNSWGFNNNQFNSTDL